MAITDDFDFIGAAADNFDCDATGGWVNGGNGAAVVLDATAGIDGGGALELRASGASGVATWEQDVTQAASFSTETNLVVFWFFYLKGKGANYMTQAGSGLVVRVYYGFPLNANRYADFQVTDEGDLSLNNGWNRLYFSGRNRNGGGLGSAHNDGSDWALDVSRIQLRLDYANGNDAAQDPALYMDNWETGTKLTVSDGTPGTPIALSDVEDYSNGTGRTNGPLQVLTIDDVFVECLCSLEIGNGSDGTNNEGNLTDSGKFILFNQWSTEVACNLTVKNFSTLELGEIEVGTDDNYAVNGCQLVLPASRIADVTVENGGTLNLYDCKLFRWQFVTFDEGSTVELRQCDIDSCDVVRFRSAGVTIQDVGLHDAVTTQGDQAGEMTLSPSSCTNFLVYQNTEGVHFRGTVSITEYNAQDNTNFDLAILEGETVTVTDGVFDDAKIKRIT